MSEILFVHPATQKSALRRLLRIDRAVTTVQLERLGLTQAANWLGLEPEWRTCRPCVTQSRRLLDLGFVSLNDLSDEPTSTLMHWAGLAEQRTLLGPALQEPYEWNHTDARGISRRHLPDAALRFCDEPNETAVEFDAGYDWTVIEAKLRGASRAGYAAVVWGSTVRARPAKVAAVARQLRADGELPGLQSLVTHYVDFWTSDTPYKPRPYSDVQDRHNVIFAAARASGSGARVGSRRARAAGSS
ncbi:hypothetical protein ACI3L1_07715 [Deinococcus sp. SM5_A1]|uniref:hypothetical protein n=1 Tax=Deinococcus sp. SM5_A1 TaxID=3379094 RepID=UPI00385E8B6A